MCSCCCMFSLMHFCRDETGGSTQPPYKCMWGALHSLRHLHAITDDGFKLRYHAELHPQVQDGRHLASTRHPCTGMWGLEPLASAPCACFRSYDPLVRSSGNPVETHQKTSFSTLALTDRYFHHQVKKTLAIPTSLWHPPFCYELPRPPFPQ